MDWRTIGKYFLHGIAFYGLTFVLVLVWFFLFLFLALVGFLIGIIIGLVMLMVIIGFANATITGWLWYPVKGGFWTHFFHGLVPFIALLIVYAVVYLVPSIVFPHLMTTIGSFVLGSLADGFVGKTVAGYWRKPEAPPSLLEGYEPWSMLVPGFHPIPARLPEEYQPSSEMPRKDEAADSNRCVFCGATLAGGLATTFTSCPACGYAQPRR